MNDYANASYLEIDATNAVIVIVYVIAVVYFRQDFCMLSAHLMRFHGFTSLVLVFFFALLIFSF